MKLLPNTFLEICGGIYCSLSGGIFLGENIWSQLMERVFEKLIVAQLFKTFPAFYVIPAIGCHVNRIPPLDPTLSWLNPVHTFTSC
jgi:hypothetical protein